MPAVNVGTQRKIIKQAGKPYYTKKGNTYLAVPLFDNKGRKHGHVIYMKTNLVDDEKPCFACYVPLDKYEREVEHMHNIANGNFGYLKKGCIALDR